MLVRDIMTEDPTYVIASEPITIAMDLLNEHDVRHLPVLENGELVGMISDRDIRNYDYALSSSDEEEEDLSKVLISGVMSSDCYSVGPEDSVGEIIRLMIDQKYGAVPVVDPVEGELVGIVSYIDILRACEDLLDD